MDGYATHQPLLIYAALRTRGPILELGAGDYSTPILHAVSGGSRSIVTLESNPEWLERFGDLRCDWHTLRIARDWPEAIAEVIERFRRFGLVFVDQAPSIERGKAMRQLRGAADVLVAHDTQRHDGPEFAGALDVFTFGVEDRRTTPYTAAVSDVVDVREWREAIPGIA